VLLGTQRAHNEAQSTQHVKGASVQHEEALVNVLVFKFALVRTNPLKKCDLVPGSRLFANRS
jgi:hypothetical protein